MCRNIMTISLWLIAVIFAAIITSDEALAQLSINPNRIIISSSDPSREIELRNTGNEPLEVSTRTMFAIWRSDSNGVTNLDSLGTPEEMALSCAGWMKVFPKQFTMAPGTSRKVRILITSPAGTADREYMARLIIGSAPIALPNAPVNNSSDAITATLRSVLHMSLAVMFRKGKSETGLAFNGLRAVRRDTGTSIFVDARPLGNAAYRGTLFATLRDAGGALVDSVNAAFIAEIPQRVRLNFPRLRVGSYLLTIESRTVLAGTASETVIRALPVKSTYDLVATDTDIMVTPRKE